MSIGPGMADKAETHELAERLLPGLRSPVALDALALACVTADDAVLEHLGGNVVLTPNPTEIAYCLHVEAFEDDQAGAAVELARRTQAVVGDNARRGVDRRRRPALAERQRQSSSASRAAATSRGITAGLLARGADPAQAAVWAAYLHGRTGSGCILLHRGGWASSPGAAGRGAASAGGDRELSTRTGPLPCQTARKRAYEEDCVADDYIAELPFGAEVDDDAFVAPDRGRRGAP